ncbi:MAG: VWA domain-containing protein [Gammaproteobacteria bacterium]|nr:VWA domain-containing protein [Gammaproteobacteria bacterium]
MSAEAADEFLSRTLALCRRAKAAKIDVTPGRLIDAFRALDSIDCFNVEDFRVALRANLVSSREEEQRFDRVFEDFLSGVEEARQYRPGIRGESMQGSLGHHYKEMDQEVLTLPENFSAEALARDVDLMHRWDAAAPPIEQAVRELARRLATRPSRRTREDRRGRRIDLRRSVRRNTRHGMDMVELARAARRTRKTRLVMLCDVSGSMDAFNPFLLQLMFGLQQALKSSRTLVFSTQVTEVTALLRRRTVTETLREIGSTVRHWSGGTNIGAALAELNRGVIREGAGSATVAIVISDGYDNGDPRLIAREMETLRRRVRTIVWINPMYGASTFRVRAAGMRAALPFVDHFLPAFDAKSLKIVVRELGEI